MEVEIRKKVGLHYFLILYDNINFHKHLRNTYIFNCRAQINYTARCIYFLDFLHFSRVSGDNSLDFNFWHKQYFSATSIDPTVVNKLGAKSFIFLDMEHFYKAAAIQHIISEVIGRYFAKDMQNQKTELNGMQFKNLYLSINSH